MFMATFTYIHAYIHTYIHIYTCMYMHTYTYIHIHINRQFYYKCREGRGFSALDSGP